ncbi:hypothetical protein HLB27_07745 [Dickeya dadantii]|nr:hypothetical protein [Dickeya dadantii]NPE70557.1 hypothetical protein [Dickeya dadantii]
MTVANAQRVLLRVCLHKFVQSHIKRKYRQILFSRTGKDSIMAVEKPKASSASNTDEEKAGAKAFPLVQIVIAMEKMGWKVAPQLMKHWFSISPAVKWTIESKNTLFNTDARTLKENEYNDTIVKMDWALKYPQVIERFHQLQESWDNHNAIALLKERLVSEGYTPGGLVKLGYSDSARVLDASAQVSGVDVGGILDTINDWYGAIGKANLKLAVRGYTSVHENKSIFSLESIGVYLKDAYDFVDERVMNSIDIIRPELLGVWSKDRILNKVETVAYFSYYIAGLSGLLGNKYPGFYPIWNSDFRRWQERNNSGGDFIVFSDVFWFPPSKDNKVIFL